MRMLSDFRTRAVPVLLALATGVALMPAPPGRAQDYPGHPVRLDPLHRGYDRLLMTG